MCVKQKKVSVACWYVEQNCDIQYITTYSECNTYYKPTSYRVAGDTTKIISIYVYLVIFIWVIGYISYLVELHRLI
jgi:hypothetical protein